MTDITELDEFTRAYIACALWSSNDESTPDGGDFIDANYGPENIEPASLHVMIRDCAAFQAHYGELIDACDEWIAENGARDSTTVALAGHDFWLTRNGHGAGFWETDRWPEAAGKILSDGCDAFGPVDLTVYEGEVSCFTGSALPKLADIGEIPNFEETTVSP